MLYVLLCLLVFLINFGPWRVEACKTAADCAYSGECTSEGNCKCNVNWSGPNCTTLRLLPSSFPMPQVCAVGRVLHASGSVIWDPEQELWVIFFADFEELQDLIRGKQTPEFVCQQLKMVIFQQDHSASIMAVIAQ